MPEYGYGTPSAGRWVSFVDAESGDKVHLNIVLFRTLQKGRHLGYVREALVIEADSSPQVNVTTENGEEPA
jgi:hypothetical protein